MCLLTCSKPVLKVKCRYKSFFSPQPFENCSNKNKCWNGSHRSWEINIYQQINSLMFNLKIVWQQCTRWQSNTNSDWKWDWEAYYYCCISFKQGHNPSFITNIKSLEQQSLSKTTSRIHDTNVHVHINTRMLHTIYKQLIAKRVENTTLILINFCK